MITEDYVSFETAKLLKEKGFDGDTNCYYIEGNVDKNLCYSPIRQNHNKRIANNEFDINIDISSGKISAPTLQMAMKWLREKYNFSVEVHFFLNEENDISSWNYDIIDTVTYCNKAKYDMRESFKTFEEACEAAIKYCLENLI